MDIYHSTYTQYIDQMNQLKDDVEELADQVADDQLVKKSALNIVSLIDETIYTASAETFLPSGELHKITLALKELKGKFHAQSPAEKMLFKPCFKTIHSAAIALKQISDDCALKEAYEVSAQEMY